MYEEFDNEMSETELEKSICTYEAAGNEADFRKLLNCLYLSSVYFCDPGDSAHSFYLSIRNEDYLPVFSSKKQIMAGNRGNYVFKKVVIQQIHTALKTHQSFSGCVINYRIHHVIINKELLFELAKREKED